MRSRSNTSIQAPWTGLTFAASVLGFIASGVVGRDWRALACAILTAAAAVVLVDPLIRQSEPGGQARTSAATRVASLRRLPLCLQAWPLPLSQRSGSCSAEHSGWRGARSRLLLLRVTGDVAACSRAIDNPLLSLRGAGNSARGSVGAAAVCPERKYGTSASACPRGRPWASFTRPEEGSMSELLLDRAGRRRSPATMPGFHADRSPSNKGLRYPADPRKVEEIVAVMHAAGERARPPASRPDRNSLASVATNPGGARAG